MCGNREGRELAISPPELKLLDQDRDDPSLESFDICWYVRYGQRSSYLVRTLLSLSVAPRFILSRLTLDLAPTIWTPVSSFITGF